MSYIDDYNYYNDYRYKASRKGSEWNNFDESKMLIAINVYDEEEDIEEEVEFPAEMAVCYTCNGKGKYVNPSIDAGGLTHEDFHSDPGFYEDYTSGVYDVTCATCEGKRVIPTVNESRFDEEQKKKWEIYLKQVEDDIAYENMCIAERSMGA